jgi:hypothetical protein
MNDATQLDGASFELGEVGQFQPHARYHHGLDMVVYVTEDCSYTSEPVDAFLTLFWHPSQERLVGVKLKGFRHAFVQVRDRLGWEEGDWLPLVSVLELRMEQGLGEEIMRRAELRAKYDLARKCVAQVALPPAEASAIAAAA